LPLLAVAKVGQIATEVKVEATGCVISVPEPAKHGWAHTGLRPSPQSYLLLAKKLGKLVTKLPAQEFGEDLGQERRTGFRVDRAKQRCMLRGKEPDKELTPRRRM
jgi:hypothetical protein